MATQTEASDYLRAALDAASVVRGISASTPRRKVAAVGVIGAGTMGSGIAMVFANAELPVTLIEKDADGLARGLSRIDDVYERARTKGTLPEPELTARRARITGCTDFAKLRDADLIVEAVFEDMAVKSDVFVQLDKIAKPGAILASNTSALDIDAIAAVTSRPQDIIGLHFFSPAHVMRLLEIVRGAKTDPSVLATAVTLARAIGKVGVVVGVCDGFCANRMLYPYLRQADCLMEEGALPQDIDRALTAFGFAMGPCAMLDMAGHDVAHFVRQRQLKSWPANMRYSRLADILCERGRFGSKVGAGWYQYPSGPRSAQRDPDVEAMIVEESAVSVSRGVRFRTKRSSPAASISSSTRARTCWPRASWNDQAILISVTSMALAFRPQRVGRCTGPTASASIASMRRSSRSTSSMTTTGRRRRCSANWRAPAAASPISMPRRQWREHGYAAKAL